MTWIFFGAHDHAAGVDGGVLRVRLAADELVAFLDRRDRLDLRPGVEHIEVAVRVLVADRTDHRAGDAVHDMGPVAEFFNFLDDGVFLLGGDVVFKYDYHFVFFLAPGEAGLGQKKPQAWLPAAG